MCETLYNNTRAKQVIKALVDAAHYGYDNGINKGAYNESKRFTTAKD
jgi:hypothetical protein